MRLTINGEEKELPELSTLASLVDHLGLTAERLAIELNGEVSPRATWVTTSVKDGDRLEIVHFVGGG